MSSVKLTPDERATLKYLAKQHGLLWGGVYQRGGDPDLIRLEHIGFIEGVARPYTVGKSEFPGGYRITPAGRAALEAEQNG